MIPSFTEISQVASIIFVAESVDVTGYHKSNTVTISNDDTIVDYFG
jgi:hypothetical protein